MTKWPTQACTIPDSGRSFEGNTLKMLVLILTSVPCAKNNAYCRSSQYENVSHMSLVLKPIKIDAPACTPP
jgi:hypothetical protein